jgi:AraC-like DNA-binding protein
MSRSMSWVGEAMSSAGEISVGPIASLPGLLTEFGCKPARVFADAGIDPRVFEKTHNRLQLTDAGRLMVHCAKITDCPHIGLLLGQRFQLHELGPLAHLLRNSETVGDALRSLILHLHWHDRGAVPIFKSVSDSTVLLGYAVYRPQTSGIPEIYDVAITVALRIMQELCGPGWKPKRVQFAYRKPKTTQVYHDLFHAPVQFNSHVSGVIFASHSLGQAIKGADPFLHRLMTEVLRDEAASKMSFGEQVQEVLYQMVLGGNYSTNSVCSLFGLHERTLRRRLAVEGLQLHDLVRDTRFELAKLMLEQTDRAVTDVSAALGYEDPNAFSRAFRSWAGQSPRQWRNKHQQAR